MQLLYQRFNRDTLGRAPPVNIIARRRVERRWEERRAAEYNRQNSFPQLRRWNNTNLTDPDEPDELADTLSFINRFENYYDDAFLPDKGSE